MVNGCVIETPSSLINITQGSTCSIHHIIYSLFSVHAIRWHGCVKLHNRASIPRINEAYISVVLTFMNGGSPFGYWANAVEFWNAWIVPPWKAQKLDSRRFCQSYQTLSTIYKSWVRKLCIQYMEWLTLWCMKKSGSANIFSVCLKNQDNYEPFVDHFGPGTQVLGAVAGHVPLMSLC